MTLAELLERAALRRPDAIAVVDGEQRLSYAELAARARVLGGGFAALGVGRGDRVLIALKNRLEHVLAYWALQVIGGVPVPVNFRLAGGELRYVLDDSGARLALYEPATAEAVREAARGWAGRLVACDPEERRGGGSGSASVGAEVGQARERVEHLAPRPSGRANAADTAALAARTDAPAAETHAPATQVQVDGVVPFGELLGAGRPAELSPVAPGDLSLILYTSGTTGRPKGVPRTHANHHAGALAHVIQCGYQWGERTLGVMPLYHTMGIHSLTSMAAVNGAFVCQPDWSAAGALSLIEAEGVTALYLIPTLFHDLVHSAGFRPERAASVRKLAYAGAPMLAALTEACVKAFRPETFVNHYGSTEIYTFSVFPDVHAKPGCAGRPGIHSTLRVVAASTERRVGPDEVVAPGEKGEIIASLDSDEAFASYWNRPDADARALRDGWYFTGDMGYLDEAGDLFVSGRVDDMIISGGENIHPVEVEEVLVRHPQVRDAAVVGEPDERWGERVVAFVVPAGAGLTAAALERHCLESADLANFKRPRRVVFVAEIPKTASGKILRRLLREGHFVEVDG